MELTIVNIKTRPIIKLSELLKISYFFFSFLYIFVDLNNLFYQKINFKLNKLQSASLPVQNKNIIMKNSKFRLYIKQHFSHPLVTQSVATMQLADGLEIKVISLTVFTNIALIIIANYNYLSLIFLEYFWWHIAYFY